MVEIGNKVFFDKVGMLLIAAGSFIPQNTQCIPVVKIYTFLELEKIISFSDGH